MSVRAQIGMGIAWLAAIPAAGAAIVNLTGMPLYPNLDRAAMDPVYRTDVLGRWCSHLVAETSDPVPRVEAWYRKAWLGSSETDLIHDADYRNFPSIAGIKLEWGIDSVTVYKATPSSRTSILLSRCSHSVPAG